MAKLCCPVLRRTRPFRQPRGSLPSLRRSPEPGSRCQPRPGPCWSSAIPDCRAAQSGQGSTGLQETLEAIGVNPPLMDNPSLALVLNSSLCLAVRSPLLPPDAVPPFCPMIRNSPNPQPQCTWDQFICMGLVSLLSSHLYLFSSSQVFMESNLSGHCDKLKKRKTVFVFHLRTRL